MDKKILITVPVFGDVYSDIFLNYQLKAFLDPSNIPLNKDRVDFAIYTDGDTIQKIQDHDNFKELRDWVPSTRFFQFTWPDNADRFASRYQVLISTFRMSVVEAMKHDVWLSAIVADLVPAKEYVSRLLRIMDAGHDSIFMLPLRSAMETVGPELANAKGALTAFELCDLGYKNLHPLWVACHWENYQFTKLPFSLLWNSGSGLLARSFSITPIVFTPRHEMISCASVIDVEIPGMCKNPYWCTNWIDAPIIGVEPLKCYYPPFANRPAASQWIREWALSTMHSTQMPFIEKKLYYPCESVVNLPSVKLVKSDMIVEEILGKNYGNLS